MTAADRPAERPLFAVRIELGLVTHWFGYPLRTHEEASEARLAIHDCTGEYGAIEEVILVA